MVSYRKLLSLISFEQQSLNPYCSGQWSRTYIIKLNAIVLAVLILVVMEDGLILNAIDRKRGILPRVLILVVMDNGLVLY